jgi:hypothetical protein
MDNDGKTTSSSLAPRPPWKTSAFWGHLLPQRMHLQQTQRRYRSRPPVKLVVRSIHLTIVAKDSRTNCSTILFKLALLLNRHTLPFAYCKSKTILRSLISFNYCKHLSAEFCFAKLCFWSPTRVAWDPKSNVRTGFFVRACFMLNKDKLTTSRRIPKLTRKLILVEL